jgi:hypothetical protein
VEAGQLVGLLGGGVRRRVFLTVFVLTALAFLTLYGLGAHFAFAAGEPKILDPHAFTGATIFGLAMFATLFLGAVLAVFLTLGAVRGDTESGLLQPIVVRPIGRTTVLLAASSVPRFSRARTCSSIGRVASWTLPFEGLYAASLHALILLAARSMTPIGAYLKSAQVRYQVIDLRV